MQKFKKLKKETNSGISEAMLSSMIFILQRLEFWMLGQIHHLGWLHKIKFLIQKFSVIRMHS